MGNLVAKNYQAWDIDPQDFFSLKTAEDRLIFLVKFAVLAPSSHNSQPWEFIPKQNSILVKVADQRRLPASDLNNRQLFISIGCAIENILIASNFYKLDYEIKYFLDDEEEAVAEIIFKNIEKSTQKKEGGSGLIYSILTRSTNRNKYEDKTIDENFLTWIGKLSSEEFKINFAKEKNQKSRVAYIVKNALKVAIKNKEFRNELSQYILPNGSKKFIGMPGFGFGLPSLISVLFPIIIKKFDISRPNAEQEENLLKNHTPILVVVSSKNDNKLTWVRAGQLFQKIALEAERQNIKTAIMAAAIQIDEFYKDIQKELGIDYRPQVFFRMGYCDKQVPHSPRLEAESVIKTE